MSFIQLFKTKGPSGFGYGSTAEEVTKGLSLEGKTILVTGCNSGLGYETMRVLSLRGAKVIGTARTLDKAKKACEATGTKNIPIACELADPKSVYAAVEEIKKLGLKLDALIANAGIMALPKLEQAFGYELQFFTNHIGHFILVTGLLGLLTDEGRVVMLSSSAHQMAPKGAVEFDNLSGEKNYTAWKAYGQAKISNLLFAKELARKFQGTKKVANAVHPGVIQTNLARHMNPIARVVFGMVGPIFLKSVAQGAATQVYAAVHPATAKISGEYFADVNVSSARSEANDAGIAKKLWEVSEKIVEGLPKK
jgi:WW domain-containing oxidoreductase